MATPSASSFTPEAARHGETRLGDGRGQDHLAPALAGFQHRVLLVGLHGAIERAHLRALKLRPAPPAWTFLLRSTLDSSINL